MTFKKIKLFLLFFLLPFVYGLSANSNADNQGPEKRISELVGKMTLEEKVAMIHGNSMFTNGGCPRLGIPQLQMSDGPHGVREEISVTSFQPAGWTSDSASYFPTGTAVAATWNRNLSFIQGKALGSESRARKKDIILGPGVNIHRTPLCGRNFEYLSEDPFLISEMAVPYVKGIQSMDVAACVKHYVANNQEKDRGTVDIQMSDRALHEIYLPGYKSTIQEGGALTLMGAYNKFRGDWCCESKFLLRDILRDKYGFKGIVMTDWGALHSTVKGANAGLDLEMGSRRPFNQFYFGDSLIYAVQTGNVSMAVLDEKVSNILRVMFSLKMMDDSLKRATGEFVTPAHSKVAFDVASESVVLLQNRRNLLPLETGRVNSITVLGDNADRKHAEGGFSSGIKAKYEITPLTGLKNKAGDRIKIHYSLGYEKTSDHNFGRGSVELNPKYDSDSLIREAVRLAQRTDVVIIFAGINHDYDTEGYDKKDIALPYKQVELINAVSEANPNTILVITAGSPVDLRKVKDKVSSILWSWYNGMEGGNVIADVIMGKINPSGKMPFTLPESLEQSPAHALNRYHGKEKPLEYEEDILVGYRWFDYKKINPLFPFGHGLSYTSFLYSDMSVRKSSENLTVTFTIQNTGKKAGAEVAQVYISSPGVEALRPPVELKGFEKVSLKPGQKGKVKIIIPVKDLAWYNEKISEWQVEKGNYKVMVGSSSRDIRLKKEFEIK
ncbi:MAG: glycoside hydrolase family 3 C-terminal domain-containing protein [Prolixibacteraceae bacterium]|nr:glycoside hydrolase family 3 C-terminal domain-containing protein [Prolixibacteraceae bacterium]